MVSDSERKVVFRKVFRCGRLGLLYRLLVCRLAVLLIAVLLVTVLGRGSVASLRSRVVGLSAEKLEVIGQYFCRITLVAALVIP